MATLTDVEHVVPSVIGAVQLDVEVVVMPPVGVSVGRDIGVTQILASHVDKIPEIVEQLVVWPPLHEVPVVITVEQVVIGHVHEFVLIDGMFASAVLLLLITGGVVSETVLVEVMVVDPSLHEPQGTVMVVSSVYVLQVDVTVVTPPVQVWHARVTVVSYGVDGIEVLMDDEVDDGDSVKTGAIGVLLMELEVIVVAETLKVTGMVVVTAVVEIVVFMLVVTTPLVVIVHGEVIVMVDMVVIVLIVVTVLPAGVALDEL